MSFFKKIGKFIDSPIGGFVTGGVGGIIQGIGSYKSAQKQMKFQREMSGTAVQRQMADMRKAGINPILAAKYGGASTPSGASYTLPNIGAAAVEGYKGASSAKQMQAQAKLAEQNVELTKANVKKVLQDTEFGRVLHSERWQRLFASMSPENVAASVLAVLNGVNVGQVLKGTPVVARGNLQKFLEQVARQRSTIFKETQGLEAMGNKLGKEARRFVDDLTAELTK